MSFAGILGAGLLGGAASAAKGAGDRIREEAKQKRETALQAQVRQDAFDVAEQEQKYAVKNAETKFSTDKALLTHTGDDLTGQKDLLKFQAGIASTQATLLASLQQDTTAFSQAGAASIKESEMRLDALLKIKDNQDLAAIQAEETNLKALIAKETAATKVETDAAAVGQKVTTDAVVVDQAQTNALELQAAGGLIKTEQQKLGYAERLKQIELTKVGEIKDFYDETTGMTQPHERMADNSWEPRGGTKAPDASTSKGLTLQNGYNDKGEEVKGYMSGTTFVQVGAAKAVKATTEKEARDYLTKQAKFLITGASNSFMATPLSDEDASLVASWVDEGMTSWSASGSPQNLSSIVKNVMFKPWKLKDSDITSADMDTAEDESDGTKVGTMKVAREIATRRQPDFIKAQAKYDAFVAAGTDPAPVLKMMIKMGYDPDLLTK